METQAINTVNDNIVPGVTTVPTPVNTTVQTSTQGQPIAATTTPIVNTNVDPASFSYNLKNWDWMEITAVILICVTAFSIIYYYNYKTKQYSESIKNQNERIEAIEDYLSVQE